MALCVVRLDTRGYLSNFINVGSNFTFFRERDREIYVTARRTENIIQ